MKTRCFKSIAGFVSAHPWKIVVAALLLTVFSAVYASLTLKLNANQDDLVSRDLDYSRRYLDFLDEFGDEEYLYVVVESEGNPERAKRFISSLAGRLHGIDGLSQVIWKIENPVLEKNFLLYLTTDQLTTLKGMLTEGAFSAKNIASWHSFAELISALTSKVREPVSKDDEGKLSQGFTFIDSMLDNISAALAGGKTSGAGLESVFFGGDETFDSDGYYRNGDLYLIMIMPDKDFTTMSVIEKPLADIRAAIKQTKSESDFADISAGLTGRPVLSADEMQTSDRDTTRATLLAIVLVGMLFVLFFGSFSRPMLAMTSLIMGISWTFGLVSVVYGTLNILSIVFTLILIGASIEYAIHIVARYQEYLSESGEIDSSIAKALATSGRADLTSALTTSAAFLTIMWTDFTALAQLGFIAASGILLCLTSMLIVLPAMIIIRDRRRAPMDLKKVKPFAMPYLSFAYRKTWVLGIAALILSVVAVVFAPKTGFDNNLLNLQADGLESVKYEHIIMEKSSETTWFARAVTESAQKSHELAKEFEMRPSVRKVDDVERIVPEHQLAKIQIIEGIAPAFANLLFSPLSGELDAAALSSSLTDLSDNLMLLQNEAFKAGRADAVEELDKFGAKASDLAAAISSASSEEVKRVAALQENFFKDLHNSIEILASGMDPTTISEKDLPADILRRFVSPKGRYSMFIYPKEDIWDPVALEHFVSDIRSVHPEVFGTPISVYESAKMMRETFLRSAILAFVVIFVLVLIDFRSVKSAVMAVSPLAIGLLWLLGGMGFFGIPFNMANFFAIPILIGIGVDFGVHMVHRLRLEKSLSAMTSSTAKAVVLTALTNAIGFGAMVIASHRGIASLGKIMAIASAACLAATMIVLPSIAKAFNYGNRSR
ncbi:MAG TPA: MMPL family transporter [bacterium]|nr:MMPL family transporter [Myxococcales bacterium]HQG13277.1 MMPL family transporter [bacterium]HQH80338.1 MMPL family transporter [bacterium]